MDYPIKTPTQLGAVLKGFRRDQKFTQADLGARVGLPQNAISDIESSPDRSSLARVFKLLAALDLDLVIRPRQSSAKRSEW
ncbi:MAG TPA: helix-turn-helix domain-containing protein [Bryobacteraceae bacterium]|nr:helix-turn-helix domain-containing protein [Bryobacteraceae bacterium]